MIVGPFPVHLKYPQITIFSRTFRIQRVQSSLASGTQDRLRLEIPIAQDSIEPVAHASLEVVASGVTAL